MGTQVKPYYYKDDAAIAATNNQQPYNIPIITTVSPATIKSIQRQPNHLNPNNLNKQYANNFTDLHSITLRTHSQAQQHDPNNYQYVLPVVDTLLPQQRPLQASNTQYIVKVDSIINAIDCKSLRLLLPIVFGQHLTLCMSLSFVLSN